MGFNDFTIPQYVCMHMRITKMRVKHYMGWLSSRVWEYRHDFMNACKTFSIFNKRVVMKVSITHLKALQALS